MTDPREQNPEEAAELARQAASQARMDRILAGPDITQYVGSGHYARRQAYPPDHDCGDALCRYNPATAYGADCPRYREQRKGRPKVSKVVIAFDTDYTLVRNPNASKPKANKPIRSLLKRLSKLPNVEIHLWSHNGRKYAEDMAGAIGITKYIDNYSHKDGSLKPDISFDNDPSEKLGKVNILV